MPVNLAMNEDERQPALPAKSSTTETKMEQFIVKVSCQLTSYRALVLGAILTLGSCLGVLI